LLARGRSPSPKPPLQLRITYIGPLRSVLALERALLAHCRFGAFGKTHLMAHLTAKQAGMPPQPKQSWTVPRRAINLMEALRRSIAADKKAEARRTAPARKTA
jgi:hypothetical protein